MNNLYYFFDGTLLLIYDDNKDLILKIPANVGDNLLLTLEDYIEKHKLNIKFNQLIPLK